MRFIALLAVVLAALVVGACGTADGSAEAGRYIRADYDERGRLQQLRYDRNKNGRVETIAIMQGARLLRIEIDADENGSTDRWEYYGDDQTLEKVGVSQANDGVPDTWAFQDSNGEISRVEISTGRDATVNRTEYYDNGALVRVEEDSDGNGRMDRWEVYTEGILTSVAFDTTGAGKPDRRLVYKPDGSFERIEVEKH